MQLSAEECIGAAEECGAPVVSIAGGEPLLHPDMPAIARGLGDLKKFVYLCTNAQLVAKRLHEFQPCVRRSRNVHRALSAKLKRAATRNETVWAKKPPRVGPSCWSPRYQ